MNNVKGIKCLILFFSFFISCNLTGLTTESVASQTKARSLEVYMLQNKSIEKVMIVGAGHKLYDYPINFFLVDSNRAFNVDPDFVLDITTNSPPGNLQNQFNIVVFEYVANDILTLRTIQNAYAFLKDNGIFLFDAPDETSYIYDVAKLGEQPSDGEKKEFPEGNIWTFFKQGKLDVYLDKPNNPQLQQRAMELIREYVENLLTQAGFTEIHHIDNIKASEYNKYVISINKEALPKFIVSAKKS